LARRFAFRSPDKTRDDAVVRGLDDASICNVGFGVDDVVVVVVVVDLGECIGINSFGSQSPNFSTTSFSVDFSFSFSS
jgi:hypothetical protein